MPWVVQATLCTSPALTWPWRPPRDSCSEAHSRLKLKLKLKKRLGISSFPTRSNGNSHLLHLAPDIQGFIHSFIHCNLPKGPLGWLRSPQPHSRRCSHTSRYRKGRPARRWLRVRKRVHTHRVFLLLKMSVKGCWGIQTQMHLQFYFRQPGQ